MTYDPDDTLPPAPPTPINPDLIPTLALVLVWSEREPERVGEIAFFPFDEARIVGARADADPPLARFGRQRLGPIVEPQSPLAYPIGEVRPTARMRIHRDDEFTVERLGAGIMLVNGEEREFVEVAPGDTVTLDDQAVFVCVLRAPLMEVCGEIDTPYFGEPDGAGIVGESRAAWTLRADLAHAARADEFHVFLFGEPGTGHAAAAAFLHRASRRAAGPFLAVDALPYLTEDPPFRLFGNAERYPPAGEGLIAAAAHGTLVLNELGAVPVRSQRILSRVLDSGSYRPIGCGERNERRSDLRVIGTTSGGRDAIDVPTLSRFIKTIGLSPLRDRPEDIPLIARHLLKKHAASSPELAKRFFRKTPHGTLEPRITPRLVDHLVRHPLPGNVDELETLLLRALETSPGPEIDLTGAVHERSVSLASGRPPSPGAVS